MNRLLFLIAGLLFACSAPSNDSATSSEALSETPGMANLYAPQAIRTGDSLPLRYGPSNGPKDQRYTGFWLLADYGAESAVLAGDVLDLRIHADTGGVLAWIVKNDGAVLASDLSGSADAHVTATAPADGLYDLVVREASYEPTMMHVTFTTPTGGTPPPILPSTWSGRCTSRTNTDAEWELQKNDGTIDDESVPTASTTYPVGRSQDTETFAVDAAAPSVILKNFGLTYSVFDDAMNASSTYQTASDVALTRSAPGSWAGALTLSPAASVVVAMTVAVANTNTGSSLTWTATETEHRARRWVYPAELDQRFPGVSMSATYRGAFLTETVETATIFESGIMMEMQAPGSDVPAHDASGNLIWIPVPGTSPFLSLP